MKAHATIPLALAAVLSPGWTGPLGAQERSPEELAELRARIARVAEPGPEHERLMSLQGEWTWEGTIQPAPGAEAMTASGTATARSILGGRFLELRAELVEGDGAPRSARLILGFDRRWEEHTVLGLDTGGTYWVTARGGWDAEREAAVMSGRDYDPVLDHTQLFDFVLSFPDPDSFRLDIVFKDEAHAKGQGPFTMVTTTYRRR